MLFQDLAQRALEVAQRNPLVLRHVGLAPRYPDPRTTGQSSESFRRSGSWRTRSRSPGGERQLGWQEKNPLTSSSGGDLREEGGERGGESRQGSDCRCGDGSRRGRHKGPTPGVGVPAAEWQPRRSRPRDPCGSRETRRRASRYGAPHPPAGPPPSPVCPPQAGQEAPRAARREPVLLAASSLRH